MSEKIKENPELDQAVNAANKISSLSKALNEAFIDRSDEIRCCLLALAAKEHAVLIGAAGTSKSLLIDKLSNAIGLKYFHTLLCKDSKADQLFGPLSINAIKNDVRKRVTTNRLPEAEVAFLDEVFKANSTILNNLLTAMNERKFENPDMQTIPLKTVFGASNELPSEKVLDALYDRFLIRRWVKNLKSRKSVQKLLLNDGLAKVEIPKTDWSNFQIIYEASKEVENDEKVLDAYYKIVSDLGITSDRRILKAYRLMKVNAALSGRKTLKRKDLTVLRYVLWNNEDDINRVSELIAHNIGSKVRDASALFQEWISNLGLDPNKVDNLDGLLEDIAKLGASEYASLLQDARQKHRRIETELKLLAEQDEECEEILGCFEECYEQFRASMRLAFGL